MNALTNINTSVDAIDRKIEKKKRDMLIYDDICSDLIMFELKNIMQQTIDGRQKITSAKYAKRSEAAPSVM